MRIGVDASCWTNKRGFGRFTRKLLSALLARETEYEFILFIDSCSAAETELPTFADVVVVPTGASAASSASSAGRRSIGDVWSMSKAVRRCSLDAFFFPTVYTYFPILDRAKVILTIHDVIAEHHPELIFPNTRAQFFWKLKLAAATRQADIVATVSEFSRSEIERYYGIPASKMRIIREAADERFLASPSDEKASGESENGLTPNDRYLLYVGGISPHKNLDRLIDAFKVVQEDDTFADVRLVLVGDYKDDPFYSAYPSLKKQVDELGLDGKVVFTGFVPDDDLARLYADATLLVFPSLEEGFGLPAIEAMACGTPVAASRAGSLPEVLASAGRFFDPKDPTDIANVIISLLNDEGERTRMRVEGLTRSQLFSWENAATDTLAIFDELRPN